MEDLAEVSMEQEFSEPAAEVAAEGQPEELVPDREEPNEETENVPEVSGEEGSALEAGAEDSQADFDGNEVPEAGPPEIDPAVYAGWRIHDAQKAGGADRCIAAGNCYAEAECRGSAESACHGCFPGRQ